MADRSVEAASGVVDSIHFSFYTAEEARKLSVKSITKPDLLDAKNTPVLDGLYDPALGPLKDTDSCKSCFQLSVRCPGHFGHIDLAKPLYNPLLFRNLKSLLQITCFHCHKFRMKEEKVQLFALQLELIIRGDVVAARSLYDLSLSESFFPEEEARKSVAQATNEANLNSKGSKEQNFTSLQHTEARHVLHEFMHRVPKKCDNCGRNNPRITCPTFGWLNKTMQVSDVRANLIRGSNLGLSSIDGDQPDNEDASDVEADEVLQSDGITPPIDGVLSMTTEDSKETLNQMRGLPREFITQMQSSGQKHLLPSEVEHIFEGLWKNEFRLCKILCDVQGKSSNVPGKGKGYAMFFLKVLLVPPSKFRPPAGSNTRGVLEHPQNVLLSKVLESNISLRNLIATGPDHPDIVRKWMDLQRSVNILFDSSKGFGKSDRENTGVRQLLEKKTGILRQKMMGKRVNFACRSVISPDPYLAVNEIGIPPYFALRLTYPERVTPWNVDKLRHAIDNGPDIHPGATHYRDKERMYKLQSGRNLRNAISRKLSTSRGGLTQPGKGPESDFEGKIVYRHLRDGDIVLVNRQPTLHKPSMMAHIVRVLKGEKTLRMHYANCSTYNADFDGDEMNVHLPQDEISRAEAISIVNANKQYIVPTNGEPIRGLIQDHIVSAVLLTMKDTFLTGDEYHQLLCGSCVPGTSPSSQPAKFGQKISEFISADEIQPFPPAIWKPEPLWTGKQVISAILHHITRGHPPFTIEKMGRIKKEYFAQNCSEQTMHIYNNELIHGLIDKAQFGEFGLVHTVHELYGADTVGTLLSIFSRLFTMFLQIHGFTCGVDDLLLVHNADLERKRILEKSEVQSEDVHIRFAGIKSGDIDPKELHGKIEKVIQSNGDSATTRLDRMMSNSLNTLTSEINNILFPNGMLKPFPKNCMSLMTASGAKGGQVNLTQISALLGQQELEGKRVPRMVSGKTLPTFIPWDISSRSGGFISDRFLTGLRPQEYYFHCMAGRDGLVDTAIKTSRSGYLQRCLIKNLECLKVCYDHTVRDADGSVVQFTYGDDGVDVLKSSFIAEFKVLAANHKVVLERLDSQIEDACLSKSNGFIQKLPDMLREKVTTFKNKEKKKSTTHLSKKQRGSIKQKYLMRLMELKYLSSLAEPGESVGVLAAQSIGEPSTQMTLNTFHFAGRGERNVTLGIPRLQEILMNAKENIRTPIMKCPLLDGRTWEDAENLAAKFRRICVADIIESMEVCIVPFSIHKCQVSTIYKLKMKLYPFDLYPPHSDITLEARNEILEGTFIYAMEDAITKHLETLSKINDINVVSHKEGSSFTEAMDEDTSKSKQADDNDDGGTGGGDGGDDDDDSVDDQGADAEKRKRQTNDEMEYEEGNNKESSTVVDEYDGEAPSGFESEIDQVEADDDFMMGGELPDTEAKMETLENPSMVESARRPGADKKAPKSGAEKKNMSNRGRKKIKRVIYKKAEGSRFEAHFIFWNEPHILLAEIAQKTARSVYLKEYKNIEQCSVAELKRKDKKGIELQTAGVNFAAFWGLEDHLNINELESNDIHAMLKTYGVEAARATIINEVNNVFTLYGIRVDLRHLSLIADFITFHGGYRPMNRVGMGQFSTSPFTKMTFETATKFIFEAASHGELDTLVSPSASVCLGQPVKLGTGCIDVLHNLVL